MVCYVEIALKKAKVTGCPSLHSSYFADVSLAKTSDFFRNSKAQAESSSHHCLRTIHPGKKMSDSGAELFNPAHKQMVVGWP